MCQGPKMLEHPMRAPQARCRPHTSGGARRSCAAAEAEGPTALPLRERGMRRAGSRQGAAPDLTRGQGGSGEREGGRVGGEGNASGSLLIARALPCIQGKTLTSSSSLPRIRASPRRVSLMLHLSRLSCRANKFLKRARSIPRRATPRSFARSGF